VIDASISTQGQDPIMTEQTSMHHVSAPHITFGVLVPHHSACRFMHSASSMHTIAVPQELSTC